MRRNLLILVLLVISLSPLFWLKRSQNPLQPGAATVDRAESSDSIRSSSAAAEFATRATPNGSRQTVPITPEDREKFQILNQVLDSKNDNDPRLDHELKVLGPGAKALMMEKYEALSPEKLNERGTIVYLMGRNLDTPADYQFLENVLKEQPCRSLADCKKEWTASTTPDELHHDLGTEVTLAYPQLVDLKSAEANLFSKSGSDSRREAAIRLVEVGRQSPIPRVASLANDIYQRYSERLHRD